MLHDLGLLAYLLPEAAKAIDEEGERLLGSLSRLDDYRNAGLAAPEDLTNPLLMGTLLVPLGVPLRRVGPPRRGRPEPTLGEEPDGEPAAEAEQGDVNVEYKLGDAGVRQSDGGTSGVTERRMASLMNTSGLSRKTYCTGPRTCSAAQG